MRTVRLGKTGLMVSSIGFGGIPIQRLSEAESVAVVRHCLDLGVTFIDTAHAYGPSEERIGKAIAGRRDGLVLATKSTARDGATFRAEMEQSFQRLGVDYIDLFQFHNISSEAQLQEVLASGGAMEVAREAQASGRIGHIGVTSHAMNAALRMVASGQFESLMFPFNFITREPLDELIPLCRKNDVGFIVMKPMGGGMLEDANLAFKFLREYPDLVPIPGIETAREMEQNIAIYEGTEPLTDAERAHMEALREELGTQFCRRCDYCQPCPQQIPINTIVNLKSFMKRFPPDRFFAMMKDVVAQAETCIDCGACEGRCPFKLPIRSIMRENTAIYHERLAGSRPA